MLYAKNAPLFSCTTLSIPALTAQKHKLQQGLRRWAAAAWCLPMWQVIVGWYESQDRTWPESRGVARYVPAWDKFRRTETLRSLDIPWAPMLCKWSSWSSAQ